MKKNIIILSLLVFSIFWTGVYIYENDISNNVVYSQAKFVADFSNNAKVVGTADNVFVWEVLAELPSNNVWKWILKITNFNIRVLYNIKWKVEWDISVWQEAGYDEKGNLLIHVGDKLLEPWEIYLFATRWEEHLINVHKNWKHLLTVKDDKKWDNIKKIISDNKIVKDFRIAYKNEIWYEGKLKITTEKNSFKKLSKLDKEKFENIENGFLY